MVICQRGLLIKSDPPSIEIIKQLNQNKPFIIETLDSNILFCMDIGAKSLERDVFEKLQIAERPKEDYRS